MVLFKDAKVRILTDLITEQNAFNPTNGIKLFETFL